MTPIFDREALSLSVLSVWICMCAYIKITTVMWCLIWLFDGLYEKFELHIYTYHTQKNVCLNEYKIYKNKNITFTKCMYVIPTPLINLSMPLINQGADRYRIAQGAHNITITMASIKQRRPTFYETVSFLSRYNVMVSNAICENKF